MNKEQRELETLQAALKDHLWVCRIQTEDGDTIVKLFWRRVEIDQRLAPFVSGLPIRLIKELQANGFDSNGRSKYGPISQGIFSAFYRSNQKGALEIARGLVEDYDGVRDDCVEWIDKQSGRADHRRKSGSSRRGKNKPKDD